MAAVSSKSLFFIALPSKVIRLAIPVRSLLLIHLLILQVVALGVLICSLFVIIEDPESNSHKRLLYPGENEAENEYYSSHCLIILKLFLVNHQHNLPPIHHSSGARMTNQALHYTVGISHNQLRNIRPNPGTHNCTLGSKDHHKFHGNLPQ